MTKQNKLSKKPIQEHIMKITKSRKPFGYERLADVLKDFDDYIVGHHTNFLTSYQLFFDYLQTDQNKIRVHSSQHEIHEELEKWSELSGVKYEKLSDTGELNLYLHLVASEFFILCKHYGVE